MSKELNIFGVKINCFDYSDLQKSINYSIQNNKQIGICYVNFLTINIAKIDSSFRHKINSTEIIFPDGTGIWLASKLVDKNTFKKKFNLTDNGFNLLRYIAGKNLSVFLFGGHLKTLDQAKIKIQNMEPRLSIVGKLNGYTNKSDEEIVSIINMSNPDVLMVGLGTPKQEEWIFTNKQKLKSKIIISVGDLFRLYAGEKKRGPKIIQILGLEWIVRLISDPKRYSRRYLLGIPKFMIYVVQEYFKKDNKL